MFTKGFIFSIIAGIFFFLTLNGHGESIINPSFGQVLAYEASGSTNFWIHGGGLDSIDGIASGSTNYSVSAAGGQAISGIASGSINFFSYAGIMQLIYRNFVPNYTQTHFHWRNDDNVEASATSATGGTQDTTLTNLAKSTVKRLRVEIANKDGISNLTTQQFRIEYGLLTTTCSAISSWTDVAGAGGDWDMAVSQLIEAGDTTNIDPSIGGVSDSGANFLTPNGGQRETTSTTGILTLDSSQFVELEYAVQALATATNSGTYCFRVTNAGLPTNYTYSVYPQVTLSAGAGSLTLTLNSGGQVAFGSITAGTLRKTGTTNLLVTQSGATSVNITAGRQRAITNVTLASNAAPTSIPNQISDTIRGIDVFNTIATCPTVGSHPAVWPAQTGVSSGLGFTLWKDSNSSKDTTCWGAGTTEADSLNRYSALQASNSASSFITISSAVPATLYTSIGYSLEVPSTQKATNYNGAVVYTVTSVP